MTEQLDPTGRQAADPAVARVVASRGITDVLHFTTNHGLVGAGDSACLLSRDRLDVSDRLSHVYSPNCADRNKDAEWTDYVSMSITSVNNHMLGTSHRWHRARPNLWWAVLRFDAEILSHPGVYFVTTNNTYTTTLKRGTGPEALEELFAPSVKWGHYNTTAVRHPASAANAPTHAQAEVLYPSSVSLEYLTGIYVPQPDLIDEVAAMQGILEPLADVDVTCRPEVFQ